MMDREEIVNVLNDIANKYGFKVDENAPWMSIELYDSQVDRASDQMVHIVASENVKAEVDGEKLTLYAKMTIKISPARMGYMEIEEVERYADELKRAIEIKKEFDSVAENAQYIMQ